MTREYQVKANWGWFENNKMQPNVVHNIEIKDIAFKECNKTVLNLM